MNKSLVILIDVWKYVGDYGVWNMINKINKLAKEDQIEAALFATYCEPNIRKNTQYEYHPWIRSELKVYSEELVPENYNTSYKRFQYLGDYWKDNSDPLHYEQAKKQILLLEKSFNFDNIIMMGYEWKKCLHHRSFGINNLKKVLPHKKIIIYPECVSPLYKDINLVKKGSFYA